MRIVWRKKINSQAVNMQYGSSGCYRFNPLNPELNPICYLLALLAHHFLHVSRIRVKLLTLRLLMSYIYDISNLRVNSSLVLTCSWYEMCIKMNFFSNYPVTYFCFKYYVYLSKLYTLWWRRGLWGSWIAVPRILNLGTGWAWLVSFSSRSLARWEMSPVRPEYEAGGSQRQSGHFGEGKNVLPLAGIEPLLPFCPEDLHLSFPVS